MSKRCKNSTNSNAVSQNSESKNTARNAASKNYSNCSGRCKEKNNAYSNQQDSDYESNGYK